MVLDLTLRVCLVLLRARRVWKLDLFLPARRFQNGLCAEARRPDTASSILELSCVYFAWKTLGRFELSGFAVSYGYERYCFLLENSQGQAH
jgi:hypothetical protein